MRDRKIFLLGIDGLPPASLRRFVAEGRMPTFARLLQRAAVFDAIPTLPALTAPGWASIATGAHPGTLGVANILVPVPGSSPATIRSGFDASSSAGEFLWEAMDRAGLGAVVLKYPGSWPPRKGSFVQVDGAGGYADIACRFDHATSCAYVAGDDAQGDEVAAPLLFPEGYTEHWRIDAGPELGRVRVHARDPMGWDEVPAGATQAFEFVVPAGGAPSRRPLHALAYGLRGSTYLALAPRKSAGRDAVHLRAGEWTGWHVVGRGEEQSAHRFKLLSLSLDRRRVHLYRTASHRTTGFTSPPSVADQLVSSVGPVCEWTGTYDLMNGLLDRDTQLELYEQHTDWLCGAIRHLARSHPWHGFFTQWHVIEYAHHFAGASLHPDHPLHDPASLGDDLRLLARAYELADRLLATVLEVLDANTLVAVASDHGHDLLHTVFYVNELLRRRGWLSTRLRDGRVEVDWSRTAAYALFPGAIWFNMRDRWSGGTLGSGDVLPLTDEIRQALRAVVDPRTRRQPVAAVFDRTELSGFGQWGPGAPDVFFCMDRGYEPATRLRSGASELFELTIPGREATSGHGSFFPASASARTLALFAGPGVTPGARPRPMNVVDVAPTLAAFLGIGPPRACDGRAVVLGEGDLP